MPRVVYTQQLARFTEVPEVNCDAGTLRQALEASFAVNPRLRSYVLDDQSHLRTHVTAFIDGHRVRNRQALDDPLAPDSVVYVLQALTGG